MPGFDRLGPEGQGAMTGRGMGLCNDQAAPARLFGCKRGRGYRAGGVGRIGYFRQTAPVYSDNESLMEEKKALEKRLEDINQAIKKNEG